MDGELYRQEGYDVLTSGLSESGWTEIIANDVPDQKNHTFAHTHYMFAGGERDGPLATYLVTADSRDNFDLWTNTAVKRALRTGGTVEGVELECLSNGGFNGTVKLNPNGGVIFAAGAFGSAKLLLRSKRMPFPDELTKILTGDNRRYRSPRPARGRCGLQGRPDVHSRE